MSSTLGRRQRLFIAHFDNRIEELTATTTLENLGLDFPFTCVPNIGRKRGR